MLSLGIIIFRLFLIKRINRTQRHITNVSENEYEYDNKKDIKRDSISSSEISLCNIEDLRSRQIGQKAFEAEREIGRGNFGRFYKGYLYGLYGYNSKTTIAIKSAEERMTNEDINFLIDEAKMLNMIEPHPNLVSMIGCDGSKLQSKREFHILLEYCEQGDLRSYLKTHKIDIISGNENDVHNSRSVLKLALDIAKGMRFLQRKEIMHGDLQAKNVWMADSILTSGLPLAKIADFGLSKEFRHKYGYEKTNRMEVPWKWMAPEYIFDDYFTLSSDCWSYGVVLWEIMSLGRTPYGYQLYDKVAGMLESGYRLPCPQDMVEAFWSPKNLYNSITEMCFVEDPLIRCNFNDIVKTIESCLSEKELEEYESMEREYQTRMADNYLRIGREEYQTKRNLVQNKQIPRD